MVKKVEERENLEHARALAMRQRFEERTKHFLNAKQRTIGINKEALDEQVNEKCRMQQAEKMQNEEEGRVFCFELWYFANEESHIHLSILLQQRN